MKRKPKKIARKKISHRKNQRVWRIFSMFVFTFLILGSLTTYLLLINSNQPGLQIASNIQRNNLQIETFPITLPPKPTPTPKPPPVNICNHHDDGVAVDPTCFCAQYLVHCVAGQCTEINLENSGLKDRNGHPITCDDTRPPAFTGNWCQPPIGQPDGWNCLGKPVIYLYPEQPMYVDVEVQTSGDIVISDPLYPEGGWKNVYARPSGKLTYQEKDYIELFYESNVKNLEKPTTGITLNSKNLETQLAAIITKLGLVKAEKQEFLDWWVPKLQDLKSPYIFFSVISPQEKEKIDHVIYTPEPDTRIEFIAYFKPLSQPFTGKTLELPATPPQRIGFTAVEWGGTIDLR